MRRQRDERQHGERDERQPPVHQEHRRHDADEHEHVAEDRDDARREQIVERVDVGRDARHQPADRIAIVEAEVEPLQVAVHLHAQRVHDALADRLQDVRLAVLEGEAGDEQAGKERGPGGEGRRGRRSRCSDRWPAASARAGPARRSTRRGSTTNASATTADVRAQVHEQPPHQARVVRLAEDVVLHVAAHVASSSSSSSCRSCISAYTPPAATSVGVGAALDDAAVGQDENLVGVADRRDAVRDRSGRSAIAAPRAGRAECAPRSPVSTAESASSRTRMSRVDGERARDRHALLLAARQRDAALADHRVVAVREVREVVAEPRRRSAAWATRSRVSARAPFRAQPERDVAADRLGEEERLLRHHADARREARPAAGRGRRCRRRTACPAAGRGAG